MQTTHLVVKKPSPLIPSQWTKRAQPVIYLRETRPTEPEAIPAVEGAALGRDAVVDLRGRVEGELDAAAPASAEDVADDVELEEAVQEDRHDGGSGERVALRGHHRRRAEQQLDGRLVSGDGLRARHPCAAPGKQRPVCDLGAAIRSVRCGAR